MTDVDEVGSRLKRLHTADPEGHLAIDAHSGITQGEVIQVLDQALEAGFTNITFVGSRGLPK